MGANGIDAGTRVATAILRNGSLGHSVIEVEDRGGSIILIGNTATEQDRRTAEYIASSQQGVIEVINKLICD